MRRDVIPRCYRGARALNLPRIPRTLPQIMEIKQGGVQSI